jgi:predicted RecB family nuclease
MNRQGPSSWVLTINAEHYSNKRSLHGKERKGILKTCANGHTFYKRSDCPPCPVCEEERKPRDQFLSLLAAPARRALENTGITTLDQLSHYTERELLGLHGMGRSTILKLQELLSQHNMTFKSKATKKANGTSE